MTRAQLIADVNTNIFTNVQRLIKGNTENTRFTNLINNMLVKDSDANAANGYMAIDGAGRGDIAKLTSIAPAGKFLRDDGTWAAAGVTGGGTSGHIPYTNSLNQLVDSPLIYDATNDRFKLTKNIEVDFGTDPNFAPSMTSTTQSMAWGVGSDLNVSTATQSYWLKGDLDNGLISLRGQNGSTNTELQLKEDRVVITSTYSSFGGVKYGNDFSAHYTSRSLIDKGFADTTYAKLSGATFTGNVNGVTPTEITYLSGTTSNIQNQINNINAGLSWKAPVRVLCSTNITISSPGATLDGITMANGERALLNGQTSTSENGVYIFNGASTAMTRGTDVATGAQILQATVGIEEGTSADQIWMCSTNGPITIGSTSIAFIKSSNTTYTGSTGVLQTGNNFSLDNSYFSGAFTLSAGVATIGAGYVTNAMLVNSTISGKALGTNLSSLTIGTGLSGSSYNGSGAVTIAIDSTVVTLTGAQALSNKTGLISQWTNDSAYLTSIAGITAGGDLSGTYVNPTVSKIKGNTIPVNASGALTNDGSGVLTWVPVTATLAGLTDVILTGISDGQILIYNSSESKWKNYTVSGDVTITNAGVTSIGAGKVLNTMINTVAWSKITSTPTTLSGYGITDATSNSLTSAYIFVGNGSNIATGVALSGDATITNGGVLTNTAIQGKAITLATGFLKYTGSAWSFDNSTYLTTSVASSTYAPINNPTFTGAVTLAQDGTSNLHAVTLQQLNNAILGTDYKQACLYVTISTLPTYVYNNGSSGVGATITGVSFGAIAFDGITPSVGDRVLVTNEVGGNAPYNGPYLVTTVGGVATLYVLTRTTDFNQSNEITSGDAVFVSAGNTKASSTYVYNGITAPTVGTTNITFVQTQGAGVYAAGSGLTLTSNTFAVGTGAITNAMLAGSIAYSKLSLTGAILNADLAGSIAYSKLSLTNSVVSGDIVSLVWSKLTSTPTTLAGYGITDGASALLTGYTSGSGTIAGTDTILQAIQKLNGNDALKAALASPTFTGTPTLPTGTIATTQSAGNNTTAVATTAFVTSAVNNNLVGNNLFLYYNFT